MTGTIPILMYHSISSEAAPGFKPFCVSPADFEAHVRHIRDAGYAPLTVGQLVAAWNAGAPAALPAKPIVLTFDDGFRDFHQAALPILAKYNVPATLYVTTGYVGKTSAWLASLGEGSRALLSWTELAEIYRAGIEIGAHSVTHPALDLLPAEQARNEIRDSKKSIEDKLATRIGSFAYPFGFFSRATRDFVAEAGYTSACAVRYRMSTPDESRYLLSRLIVRNGTGIGTFAQLIDGRGPIMRSFIDQARSEVWRIVRQRRLEATS